MSQEPQGQEQSIILTSSHEPFKRESDAKAFMSKTNIEADTYGVLPYQTGFAVVRRGTGLWEQLAAIAQNVAQAAGASEDEQPKELFFKVRFHRRQSAVESADVELTVNCDCLKLQRGEVCVVPGRFLEAANHTRRPMFSNVPGESRKVVGEVQTYTYDTIGPATEAEYIEERRRGTAKTRIVYAADAQSAVAV